MDGGRPDDAAGDRASDRAGDAAGDRAGEVVRALDDVAALGPFFVIVTDPAAEADPAWRPFTALSGEPAPLRGLVDAYARRLGTGEDRVAASILFQGLAARLWSPVVAAAAAHGVVPDLSSLHYRWAPGAPVAFWLASPGGRTAGDPVEPIHRTVLSHLTPLREAIRDVLRSDGLAWDNAASALAGVRHAAAVRPALDGPLTDIVGRLLSREPLAGNGRFVRPFPGRPERFFVRRACCLYYRVPPGGDYCGDCALLTPGDRRRRWRATPDR
jgi:ferric iron reductase protein FhuF